MTDKTTEKLFNLIPKLGPVEFAGLARLLGVQLVEEVNPNAEDVKEKYASRDFMDVLEDVLKRFEKLGRSRKREILKLVKQASKNPIKAGAAPQMAAGPSAQTDGTPSPGEDTSAAINEQPQRSDE